MAYKPDFIEKIVISTRIRLARNFASYPFPKKMDEAQAEDIVILVRKALADIDYFKEYRIARLTHEEAVRLQEKYLISPALIKNKTGVAFVSADERISIMVNEEDHLRQQYITKEFNLVKAYERITGIDDRLSALYDFAFDEKLGFLTACPSNLGTGMRASVMLFLPALDMSGELKTLLPTIKKQGMTVRGAFGEGSTAEGYLYQLSNERTLGWSEMEIIDALSKLTMALCDAEIKARATMLKAEGDKLKDRCLRAFGVLTNCALLGQEEFLSKMTEVRLGIALGFLEALDVKGFDDFLNDMRPSAFRLSNELKNKSEEYCDRIRAETVCSVLPELVCVYRPNKGRK